MNARIFDSPDDVAHAAADAVLAAVRGKARAAIGISGGTAPLPLYRVLATEAYREELQRAAITWVLVDERFVPRDDAQSNASAIAAVLFPDGIGEHHRFLTFDTSLPDAAASARAFEDEWTRLGLDVLDLVILGCGTDGHTASLFPGSEALSHEGGVAIATFAAHLGQWRVTLTRSVLEAATTRFVVATGEGKREVIERVRAGEDLPVSMVTRERDSWWFVDRAAWEAV